ncbi:HupE/UreJ family protein [Roseivivax marinus]|uniref:HupE/UreJ family protein n=1 Tax=Roseivivax marinus TaxID=1379903 RepID=UPI00273EB13D|nr:HupE/UreJ family protein [Roseivivax marinus]
MRRFLSLLTAFVVLAASAVHAHEVRPAIADLTAEDGALSMTVTMNGEAAVAGLDLEGVEDTNATELSAEVDDLRQLPPEELAARIEGMGDDIANRISVTADGAEVPLALEAVEVGPVGNTELPRDTVLTFSGDLPRAATELRVTWPAEYGQAVLRQQGVDEPYTGYLDPGQQSDAIALSGGGADSAFGAFARYIPVGFEHIVPMGLDHILFVLGLFFLAPRVRALLWQVSAFTAAHTVTLAAGALGVVSVPASVVEPIIAASIVYVAVENILSRGLSPLRPAVVFVFGLLHGLGFASVLQEFGLPQSQFVPALLGFNVGVEVGQLFVIAVAFLIVAYALKVDRLDADPRRAQVVYGILTLAFVALAFGLNGTAFVETMGASAPVFLVPLAALAALCGLAAFNVDKLNAYRVYVATPASAAIALVGGYWFVERVFL